MAATYKEISSLQNHPLFEGLPQDLLSSLLSQSSIEEFRKDKDIFEQGEPSDYFFVILEGWVLIYRALADGTDTVLEVFGPGESFAEAAMYFPEGYPANARMVENGRLIRICTETFRQHLRENPDLAVRMLASLAGQLKNLTRRIESRRLSASQRIAEFLLRFCPQLGDSKRKGKFKLPYSKQLIANRLGMTPETFSRSLAALKKYGVETAGREVRIVDFIALERHISNE